MTLVKIIIGLALVYGGWYVSTNHSLDSVEKPLHDLGILLDLGKSVSIIGIFVMLFPVAQGFFVKPLGDAIAERTRSLEATFSEAESLRNEMTSMKSDYEKRLAETEQAARDQIQAQIKDAQDLRTQMINEANAKAAEIEARSREDMELERKKVLTDVRTHVAELSLSAAEKLLSENIDNDRNRKLIQDFIDNQEVTAS
jgi:F-type H+-transporting ATPase subunit b